MKAPILSLHELEAEAAARLEGRVYDLFAGGAEDEVTLRANQSAFRALRLVPRVLRGSPMQDLPIRLLGQELSLPVLLSPTAFHRLAHPEGELATARAAAAAGTVMIVSMAATVAIEEITAAGRAVAGDQAGFWFQLYLQPDRSFTAAIVRRAEQAGCRALVVTVDSPVFGRRERDLRNRFDDLPPGMCCENMREQVEGRWTGKPRSIAFHSALSWADLEWLRGITSLPVVLKGILHPEDARLAVRYGASLVMVSNHGGRQLDTTLPTIEALPAIASALEGSVPIVIDGGVRRGTDVVKALALGATAVAIGRPVLWGLAAGGEQGVTTAIELLRAELRQALALCGCTCLPELRAELLKGGRV